MGELWHVHIRPQYTKLYSLRLGFKPIVKDHIIALYTLLPAMKGAKADLLKQALQDPFFSLSDDAQQRYRLPVKFCIMNETEFFDVSPTEGEMTPHDHSVPITVSVRQEALEVG